MTFIAILFGELLCLSLASGLVIKTFFKIIFGLVRSRSVAVKIFSVIFIPGVFIHEMAHFITAAILLVKINKIEFSPEFVGDSISLGRVEIVKTDLLRRVIIGFAPIAAGILVIGLLTNFILNTKIGFWPIGLLLLLGVFYLIFVVSSTMFSSKKDKEGAIYLLFLVLAVFAALYLVGVRLNYSIVLSAVITDFLAKIDLFLLAPLAINLCIILFYRFAIFLIGRFRIQKL